MQRSIRLTETLDQHLKLTLELLVLLAQAALLRRVLRTRRLWLMLRLQILGPLRVLRTHRDTLRVGLVAHHISFQVARGDRHASPR